MTTGGLIDASAKSLLTKYQISNGFGDEDFYPTLELRDAPSLFSTHESLKQKKLREIFKQPLAYGKHSRV